MLLSNKRSLPRFNSGFTPRCYKGRSEHNSLTDQEAAGKGSQPGKTHACATLSPGAGVPLHHPAAFGLVIIPIIIKTLLSRAISVGTPD